MKKYISVLFAALFSFMFCEFGFAQSYNADYFNVNGGTGNGIRFWNSNYHKIHSGNTSVYHYGPVTDYSIKTNMNDDPTRGWTWGVLNTTPVAALNTEGNFQINGWMKIGSRASCNISFTLGQHDDSYRGLVVDNGGSYAWKLMELKNVQGTRMIVLGNGNVGIGTSNPTYKLAVNGTIRTKEVRVESNWGDYVFYDDYRLPTLEEEEKHIEAKGHLLGFESEEDMQGEIQLGDVSRRQQVKIEEMMLHLIDMKKEMMQLREETEELKKLLKAGSE